MQLSNKELKLLSTYQNWLKKNKLNDKCYSYFISQTSMLVFQVWRIEKLISETIWLKSDNEKWQFYIKNFSLEEIMKIEKEFVLKTFKEKQNL